MQLRCKENPKTLLAKYKLRGELPEFPDGMLVEMSCDACKAKRRKEDPTVKRVLHRYNLIGELVETEVEHTD